MIFRARFGFVYIHSILGLDPNFGGENTEIHLVAEWVERRCVCTRIVYTTADLYNILTVAADSEPGGTGPGAGAAQGQALGGGVAHATEHRR